MPDYEIFCRVCKLWTPFTEDQKIYMNLRYYILMVFTCWFWLFFFTSNLRWKLPKFFRQTDFLGAQSSLSPRPVEEKDSWPWFRKRCKNENENLFSLHIPRNRIRVKLSETSVEFGNFLLCEKSAILILLDLLWRETSLLISHFLFEWFAVFEFLARSNLCNGQRMRDKSVTSLIYCR